MMEAKMKDRNLWLDKGWYYVIAVVVLVTALLGSAAAEANDLLWAKRAGGTADDEVFDIAVDGSGNSYVTGVFLGTAIFGPGETNETSLTSAGDDDVFVAMYDSTGALVWAKREGGTKDAFGAGIAVDGLGNSYVTGGLDGAATFGPGEVNETSLTSAGDDDVFVAMYDSSGALVWAKHAGGSAHDLPAGIAVDGSGNSYVTGEFLGTATFGPGETNETSLTSAGDEDIFVAKYDTSGALLWVKREGGTQHDFGAGIAVDGSRNSYVTGQFEGSATFGPSGTSGTTLTSAGDTDIFVARFSADFLSNGSFELDPDFLAWDTIGLTRIETSLFGTGPTEGSQQARLSSGTGSVSVGELETFLGMAPGAIES
jgi:hypothetical protein